MLPDFTAFTFSVEMDGRIPEVECIGFRRSQEYTNSVRPDLDSRPRHSELVRGVTLFLWQ